MQEELQAESLEQDEKVCFETLKQNEERSSRASPQSPFNLSIRKIYSPYKTRFSRCKAIIPLICEIHNALHKQWHTCIHQMQKAFFSHFATFLHINHLHDLLLHSLHLCFSLIPNFRIWPQNVHFVTRRCSSCILILNAFICDFYIMNCCFLNCRI